MPAQDTGRSLSSSRRSTLDALARVIVPRAYGGEIPDLTARIVERIAGAPAAIADDLGRALDVCGSRIAAIVFSGRFRPLPSLRPGERGAAFERWGRSRIPVARSVHQALRRLVLSTYYALPEAHRALGLLPPLHTRAPALAWEGPLPGVRTLDSEPVARGTADGAGGVPGANPTPRALPGAVTLGSGLRGDIRLTADVIVVGSGAGGAVAAARLAEAGRLVVILEAGAYLQASDFSEEEGEMMPRLFADQAMRATTDASIALLQGGAAGGGTTVNWMLMLRTPEHVLDEWERRFGLSGLGAAIMEPAFQRIEREVHARVVPDDAHAPSNRMILEGARALGWHAAPMAINAAGCVRAGTCSLGCRYDAKQSALLTYLPRAFAAGARLLSGVRVERVEVIGRAVGGPGASAPLKRVHAVVREPGRGAMCASIVADAPVVVLAAGAVETPVLLERSGLGGGGVGRYLRLHPTTAVLGRYERDMYPLAGIPQSTMCDEFIRRDANGYGFWIECPALQPAVAAVALSSLGEEHELAMRDLARVGAFIVLVRDGSGDDASHGAVSLDRRGRTRIRYRMSERDRTNLVAGVEATARLHLAAGAAEALTLHTPTVRISSEGDLTRIRRAPVHPNRISLFSAHVNGTCRLGVDPATSGTTPDGERHGVRGLFVCDGSLLPTSLGVNPQETIMALSSVLSERIAAGG